MALFPFLFLVDLPMLKEWCQFPGSRWPVSLTAVGTLVRHRGAKGRRPLEGDPEKNGGEIRGDFLSDFMWLKQE